MHLIEALDKQTYNNFVAAQESGSFLQSWEWGEWQSALGRQVKRLKWQVPALRSLQLRQGFVGHVGEGWESGDAAAVIQLIKMPLPFGKYYLYAPYGPVTGIIGESEVGEIGSSVVKALQSNFSDAIFIRIESKVFPLPTTHYPLLTKSPNIQPAKTLLIDLSKSEEQLLLEMHHKTRYNIKVAQKHGVEIKDEFDISIGHGLFFDEALKLIIETSKRQKFHTFPAGYYKKMVDQFALKKQGDVKLHIYKAIFQNQLLSAAIIIDFGNTRTFLFGGSSDLHKNVMAPYLMHWQAMLDAKKMGLKFYDFWGIETASGDTPGFIRFKLGFGGFEKTYAGAYDIVQNNLFYKTYGILRAINKTIKKISG